MKTVTRYECEDGRLFKTIQEAQTHELLLLSIKNIESLLPPEPPFRSGWSNGRVYLQCNPKDVVLARAEFVRLYNMTFKANIKAFYEVHGRMLGDSGSILYGIWNKLTWIDEDNRMWGQGFYRVHPNPDATEYKEDQP